MDKIYIIPDSQKIQKFKISIVFKISINTYVVKVLYTLVGGQGGVPMDPYSGNAFPWRNFWPSSVHIKTTLKH